MRFLHVYLGYLSCRKTFEHEKGDKQAKTPSQPFGKPFAPSSSPPSPRSAFSFLFCVISQLYTLAVATSNVYAPHLTSQQKHHLYTPRPTLPKHPGIIKTKIKPKRVTRRTVICSLKKSRSSSHASRFLLAPSRFSSSKV